MNILNSKVNKVVENSEVVTIATTGEKRAAFGGYLGWFCKILGCQ